MAGIRELAFRHYDNNESVEACQEFFEDPENATKLERAFYTVLPILGIIVKQGFRMVDDFSVDDLVQVGAIEYWNLLNNKNKTPRPFDARAHFNLYYKVGTRAMVKILDQLEPEVANFFENNAVPFAASCNFHNPIQRIFVREIPTMVLQRVMELVHASGRFTTREIEVCEYIARCLIFETKVIQHQVRKLGGGKVANAEFFEVYVDTLVRIAFVELKRNTDITNLLANEGAALNPAYYAEFS